MTVSLRKLAVLVCCILSMFDSDAVADEHARLGLSHDELITLATGSGALTREDFKVIPLSSGEAVLVGGHSRFRISAFGDPDNLHTVRFDLLGENARQEDPAALDRIAADVMTHLFANWPEASTWPRSSREEASSRLRAAAERAREEAKTKPPDPRRRYNPLYDLDIFAFSQEAMREGKWVATFNWLFGYSHLVTTYAGCLPTRGRQYWKSLNLERFHCFQ
jgi:hypothetical protein